MAEKSISDIISEIQGDVQVSGGTGGDNLPGLTEELAKSFAEQIEAQKEYVELLKETTTFGTMAGDALGSASGIMDKAGEEYINAVEDVAVGLAGVTSSALNAASKLTLAATGGVTFFKGMFKGALVDEMSYLQGMREIAFVSEGITGETENLQNEWQRVGKTAKVTGKNITVFQKQYMKNLKQGYKTQRATLDITKTGLHVSTMIGASSESTADIFNTWHMQLGRSASEISEMGRGMKEVARHTGIMGDHLIEVAKSSENLMKQLRSIGSLTADSTKNLMTVLAEAKKVGAEETATGIMGALGGGASFHTAEGGIQSMLANAMGSGAVSRQELFSGAALDDIEIMGNIADASRDWAAKMLGVSNVTIEGLKNMTPNEKMVADMRLKGLGFKEGAAGLINALDSMEKGSLSFADRVSALQVELEKGALTTQEYASKQKLLTGMMIGEQTKMAHAVLAAFKKTDGTAADFGMTIQDALADPKYASSLKKLNMGQLQGADKVRAVLQGMAAGVNKELDAAGVSGMTIDPTMIESALSDPKQYEILLKQMDEASKAADVATKANLDPMSKIAHWSNLINEGIRDFSSGAFQWYSKIFGAVGIIATQMTVTGAMGAMGALGTLGVMNSAKNLISGSLGSAAGGAAKGAAGSAAGSAAGGVAGMFTGNILANAGGGLKTLGTSVSKIALVGGPASTALTSLGGGLTTLSTMGLSALGPIAAIGVAVLAFGGGIVSAFKAGEHAANIFNTTMEKLTISQKWAAEGAGYFTGILNTLTFGIFRKSLGPMGTFTQTVAKFFEQFPMFTLYVQSILLPFKILWGTLKGLFAFVMEVFNGIGAGIKAILTPIAAMMKAVWQPLSEAFKPFIGEGGKAISIVGMIAGAFRFLGKAVGLSFRILGGLIGFILNVFIPVFTVLGKIFGFVAGVIVGMLKPLWVGFQKLASAMEYVLSWIPGMGRKKVDDTALTSTMAAPTPAEAEATLPRSESDFYAHATKKGSIYTHDIHTESLLQKILNKMGGGSSGGSGGGGLSMGAGGGMGGSAKNIAMDVNGILSAAGSIAAGVVAAGAALSVLPAVIPLLPLMALGAVVLMAMVPAIVGLASALTYVSKTIMEETGLDAATAGDVANDVAGLIAAAGKIAAVSFVAGMAMSNMSLILPLIPLMIVGGAVLMAMSGAVVGLTAGIVSVSKAILGATGLDAETAGKVANDVAGVIFAAGKIATMSLYAGTAMASMALVLPLIPFMIVGGAVLMAMSGAVVGLTAGVVAISQGILKATGLDSETAGKVAMDVAAVISAAGKIAYHTLMAGMALTLMPALFPLIPLIVVGGVVLGMMSGAVISLAVAVLSIGQGIMSVTGMSAESGAAIAENVEGILKASGEVAWSILGMVPMLTGLGSLLVVAPVISLLMMAGVAALAILTPPIVGFAMVIGALSSAINSAIGMDSAKESVDKLTQVSGLFEAVGNVITTMHETLTPLLTSWWPFSSVVDDIIKMTPKFSLFVPVIIGMVKEGIIDPVQKNIKYQKKGEGTLKKLQTLADVFDMIGPMLEVMSNSVAPLLEEGWFTKAPIDKIKDRKGDLIKYFQGITELIIEGFVVPMQKFEWREEGTLDKLKQIPGVLGAIGPIMDSISNELIPLTEGDGILWGGMSALDKAEGLDFSQFSNILSMINNQIIKPVQANFDMKEGKNVGAIFEDLRSVFGVLSDDSFLVDMQTASANLAKAKISIIPNSVIAGIRSLGELLTELKNLSENAPKASELESMARLMPMIPEYMGRMDAAWTGTTDLSDQHSRKTNIESSRVASSRSLVNVGDQLQANYATEEPSAGSTSNTNLLAKIFAETAVQSDLLREGNNYLRTIATAHTDSGSVGGGTLDSGGTDTNSAPPMSRLNSKWPSAFHQSSMSQVVNSGGNDGQ